MTTATKQPPAQPAALPGSREDRSLILGDLSALQNMGLDFWLDTGRIAPLVKMRFGYAPIYYVTDADFAQQIFVTNNRNYIKERDIVKILETGGDKVLFTTDGDEWLWRRRLMQPAFHRKQIAGFADVIVTETEKMLDEWQDGTTIDVDEAMKMVTMMVIGKTMFNVDMAGDSAELHDAYRNLGKFIINRTRQVVKLPIWIPTQENRTFNALRSTIDDALGTIIEHRHRSKEPQNDLLDMLLSARLEDSDQTFTDNQLILEMSQIVFAGHETTATTLTWLLYLLSQHPEVEAKLRAELDTVIGNRRPTVDDLRGLRYMNQVINETMRLYPSAYVTSRESVAGDRLGDYEIPAEARILINLVGIQRDPRYWDHPEQFDPERFSAENVKTHHKAAFLPFLTGPRKCIGEPLSRVEMQLMLATILQRYKLTLPTNAIVEPESAFVLQPKGGLDMILTQKIQV